MAMVCHAVARNSQSAADLQEVYGVFRDVCLGPFPVVCRQRNLVTVAECGCMRCVQENREKVLDERIGTGGN